jgi:hypothetical protein
VSPGEVALLTILNKEYGYTKYDIYLGSLGQYIRTLNSSNIKLEDFVCGI